MQKIIKMSVCVVLSLAFVFALSGCTLDIREDSDIFDCIEYTIDGEDILVKFEHYFFEFRTDATLITRYKRVGDRAEAGRCYYSLHRDMDKIDENGDPVLDENGNRVKVPLLYEVVIEGEYEFYYSLPDNADILELTKTRNGVKYYLKLQRRI